MMKDLLCSVYMTKTENSYTAFMTHNPHLDASVLKSCGNPGTLDLLTPNLPVGMAHYIRKTLFSGEDVQDRKANPNRPLKSLLRPFRRNPSYDELVLLKARQSAQLLRQMEKIFPGQYFSKINGTYPRRITSGLKEGNTDFPDNLLLQEALLSLNGRILYAEELSGLFKGSRSDNDFGVLNAEADSGLFDALQTLALTGHIELLPSLGFTGPGEITCFRCGRKTKLWRTVARLGAAVEGLYQNHCPICNLPSFYCESCNSMGESRLCRPLYALGAKSVVNVSERREAALSRQVPPVGVPPLTPAQSRASEELLDLVSGAKGGQCLVWAVCGAGKTEVVKAAMAAVLHAGGQVLYAIPRRDVVRELAPRLEASFGSWGIGSLYGGSPQRFSHAPLIIATTHQVLRYYRRFDLVVLDEVDAYPYKGSEMLQMAVKRAVRPGGHIIYLTATPDPQLLAEVRRGRVKLVTIPARYHGHPVPEPVIRRGSLYCKHPNREEVSPDVLEILYQWCIRDQSQVFIFVPTVRKAKKYGPLLEEAVAGWDDGAYPGIVCCSYAGDPQRDNKREGFKAGRYRIFVTTSIMERGITVSNANVLVLEADFEEVFDAGSLVQMAGRTGRSAEFPTGQVVFLGLSATRAMKNACKQIQFLNRTAEREGYLIKGR